MKRFFFALSRFLLIFSIWTLGYLFWFRRLTIGLWGFDFFAAHHWSFIYEQWQEGWVIRSFKEWAFVIALFGFIPMWLIGLTIVCSISWLSWCKALCLFPVKLMKKMMKVQPKKTAKPKVTKKKSYKQTRPPAVRASSGKIKPVEKPEEEEKESAKEAHSTRKTSHPADRNEPPAKQTARESKPAAAPSVSGGSVSEIISKAGYRLISDARISGKPVSFVGVAQDHILLCLVDAEAGDWLADEERFNDEEPLWFSESNHRISPVRNILNARDALMPKLTGDARGLDVRPMVVVKQGTIINAEDMFEVWDGLNVAVCRFENGGPSEIRPLNEAVSKVEAPDDDIYRDVASALG